MNQLTLIQHNDQRVLTTKQLAEVYETDSNTISQNFKRNKPYFVEGVHYYYLTGAELKAFKNYLTESHLVGKNTPHLYLWTERGANRHCKILDTAKAWEQFDNLEDTYFRVKEFVQHKFAIPQTFSEALQLAAQIQAENERLQEQEKLLLPRATGYDLIVDGQGSQSMNEFAKSMNWGRNRLYEALREHGIFMKDTTTPMQKYVASKYFLVKQCRKGNMTFPVTFITTKGMDYLVRKVGEWGIVRDLLDYGKLSQRQTD